MAALTKLFYSQMWKGGGEQGEGNISSSDFEMSCFLIGGTRNFRGQLHPL